jgi:hypothetical protein
MKSKNMNMSKKSIEVCVWNKGWRDIDYLRNALRKNVDDRVDDEPLQRILNNVPRAILLSIGGSIPLGIELKATLNTELREYKFKEP